MNRRCVLVMLALGLTLCLGGCSSRSTAGAVSGISPATPSSTGAGLGAGDAAGQAVFARYLRLRERSLEARQPDAFMAIDGLLT